MLFFLFLETADQPSSSQLLKAPMTTTKRGVLPKHATQTMKAWLFQHIVVIATDLYSLF